MTDTAQSGLTRRVARRRFGEMSAPSTFGATALRPPASTEGEANSVAATEAKRCFHCGDPNPEPSPWHVELGGAPRYFCCAGCLGIARTIHAAGLDAFYDRRTRSADRPPPGRDGDDEWARWDAAAAQAGLVRATDDGQVRVFAAARRHPLRRVHLADRDVARTPARRRAGERQFRDAPRPRRLGPGQGTALRPHAHGRRDRLSRVSVRPGTPRSAGAARIARAAAAPRRRAARDDAGDDVRRADLRHGRRRRARPPAAAGMGEPHADAAGARLLRGAVLRRRVARPQGAPSRHGRSHRAGPRRSVRRQRVGDAHRRRRRSTTIP